MRENGPLKTRHARLSTAALALVFLVVLLLGFGWSQSTPAQPATPPPPQSPNQPATPAQPSNPQTPGTTRVPDAGVSVQEPPGSVPQQPAQEPQAETRFRSVEVILNFASRDTGLPIKSEVKRHLITRESVEKYVNKRMKDD